MGGILEMMAERGQWILGSRLAMRISDRTERGIAHGRGVKRQQRFFSERVIIERGQLHKKIMRMLAIHDGQAVRGFALLK